jgi:tetratricopeptide (TPR) repeat protein
MSGNSHIAFERISADIDNIRRAWNWAIQNEKVVSIDHAINGLSLFYANSWGVEDGIRINNDAVEMLSKHLREKCQYEDHNLCNRLYAKALAWLGLFIFQFDPDRSQTYLNQSQEIIHELMDSGVNARYEKALLFYLLGIINTDLGKYDIAQKYTDDCLSLSKEIGFDWMVLSALDLLGDIGHSSGSPREAKHWYEKFLAEARLKNNRSSEIRALHKLGLATRRLMAYDEARSYYQQGISLAKSYNNPMEETYTRTSLGFLAMFLGDFEEAIQHFRDVVAISERLGVPQRALNALIHTGFTHWMQAEFNQANTIFEKVLDQIKGKDENTSIFPIIFYAENCLINAHYSEANAQLEIANSIKNHLFIGQFLEGRLYRTLGWAALVEKNFEKARQDFEESIRLYQVIADDEQVAWSQAGLARAEIGLGNWDEAKTLLMEALWTSIEMRAFISLLFTIPVAVLYLAYEEPELSASIYQQMQSSPLPAKSKFFNDIVGQYLPEKVTKKSQGKIALQTDTITTLWSAASNILSSWMQLWMEEFEHSKKNRKGL